MAANIKQTQASSSNTHKQQQQHPFNEWPPLQPSSSATSKQTDASVNHLFIHPSSINIIISKQYFEVQQFLYVATQPYKQNTTDQNFKTKAKKVSQQSAKGETDHHHVVV